MDKQYPISKEKTADNHRGDRTMGELKIDRVLVGEALVGEGNELAHIDLIIGPRGSPAESAFCSTLTNQKRGDNALLALVAPNLMAKPATVMFNKVEIKNEKQANQMFGPAERGVAKAVVDSVKEGIIPQAEAENLFICVGVFIHWDAKDNAKIQDWNYEATKLAIARAVTGEPKVAEVIAQEDVMHHPLAAHD
jgi:5,6,7,8-tetrahydromethanopterin hydro-lyase